MNKRNNNSGRKDFRCSYTPCTALLGKYNETTEYFIEVKCQQRHCKNVNTRGNVFPSEASLVQFRCYAVDQKKSERAGEDVVCNKLLAKIFPGTDVEIKCPRCGSLCDSVTAQEKAKD